MIGSDPSHVRGIEFVAGFGHRENRREVDPGLPVGRHAHHLVLVAVPLEAQELGDGRVKNAQRIGLVDFLERFQTIVVSGLDRCRLAVSGEVHCHGQPLVPARSVEGTGRMGGVVISQEDRWGVAELEIKIPCEDLLEPFVGRPGKHDGVEISHVESGLFQAEGDRLARQVSVGELDSQEPFFLGSCHQFAVDHKSRGAVLVADLDAAREAENIHRAAALARTSSRFWTSSQSARATTTSSTVARRPPPSRSS